MGEAEIKKSDGRWRMTKGAQQLPSRNKKLVAVTLWEGLVAKIELIILVVRFPTLWSRRRLIHTSRLTSTVFATTRVNGTDCTPKTSRASAFRQGELSECRELMQGTLATSDTPLPTKVGSVNHAHKTISSRGFWSEEFDLP